MAKRRAELRSR